MHPIFQKITIAFVFCCWNIINLHAMESSDSISLRTALGLDKTPTALHYAAQDGNVEKIQLLLNGGADINSTMCHYNNTPLHIAIWFGHYDCAIFLINHGAQLDATNCHGSTVIHTAAWKNEDVLLQELLKHNVNIIKENKTGIGNTPLYLAAKAGSTRCLRILLEHSCNNKEYIDRECAGDNSTALQATAVRGRAQCYWELMVAGADYKKKMSFKNSVKSNAQMVTNNNPLKSFIQHIEWHGKDNPPRFKGQYHYCFLCTKNFEHNDVIITIKPCLQDFHTDCFEDYCVRSFMDSNKNEPLVIESKKDYSDKAFAHHLKTSPFDSVKLADRCPGCKKNFNPQCAALSVFLNG